MPRRERSSSPPNDDRIAEAIWVARETWDEWRDVFEHAGSLGTNPILADSSRFGYFCNSWRVARTLRAGTSDAFRCLLRDSQEFAAALDEHTGWALDELHANILQPRFGTRHGKRGVRSALSKVATFIRPEWFTAWDSFACAGLNIVIGHSMDAGFESFSDYLANFNDVWTGPHGARIRDMMKSQAESTIESEPRFQRRILDLYLMSEGGFKHGP
jgi:hypothetical protein